MQLKKCAKAALPILPYKISPTKLLNHTLKISKRRDLVAILILMNY
jgi:hypothetical protein